MALAMNRIGQRTIICMAVIAVLAPMRHVFGG
jgi:hypothetical protein